MRSQTVHFFTLFFTDENEMIAKWKLVLNDKNYEWNLKTRQKCYGEMIWEEIQFNKNNKI